MYTLWRQRIMHVKNLDHDILKLIASEPEFSSNDIARNLSIPEELVKMRIANFNDTREKILIFSNGRSIYDDLYAVFEPESYIIVKALESSSALETVKAEKPDLVLLDTGLIDRDVFEICRQLKTSPKYYWIPVIRLSEKGDQKSMIEALESGADDYVSTPFSFLELQVKIRKILKRRQI
jgi:two-component system, OmpR family, alkaline phosphatase synthesis response regulator PhoP